MSWKLEKKKKEKEQSNWERGNIYY